MSSSSVVVWMCDGCGVEARMPAHEGLPPADWKGLTLHHFGPDGQDERLGDYCNPCWLQVFRTLTRLSRLANAVEQQAVPV